MTLYGMLMVMVAQNQLLPSHPSKHLQPGVCCQYRINQYKSGSSNGLELPGKPTEPDEVNYTLIHGKVIEYINDIRGGRQTILIITGSETRALFDGLYKSPPYLKAVVNVPPEQVAYTLMKKVNSSENKIFCLNEDIQSTKKWLEKVRDIKDYRAPPKPPKPV